jgi:hypothetical protein
MATLRLQHSAASPSGRIKNRQYGGRQPAMMEGYDDDRQNMLKKLSIWRQASVFKKF